MSKKINHRFLAAIFVFAATSVFCCYCLAVKLNNSTCKYSVQQFTCETAAPFLCSSAGEHFPGDCISCESPASLPLASCIPYEGSQCELDGQAGTNCENVQRKRAPCDKIEIYPGVFEYSCGIFKIDGSCDSSSNFLPCY
jgi:hypothetical protein